MPDNTFYVSTTGSDANAGTLEAPFRTIKKAMDVAQAGAFIYVRAGKYPSFTVTKSGTATSPITISAYENEMPIIYGGIGIRLKKVQYVIIHGFEVTKASGHGALNMGGIVISGGGYNTVEYCKVHGNLIDFPNGIMIRNSSNNQINHNTVFNNGNVGIFILGSYTASRSRNNQIGWNTVYGHTLARGNADGIGLQNNVGSTYIHDNVVYANADDGIDTWNTPHNTIVGNTVYGQVGPGDGNGFKLGGGSTGGSNIVKQNIAYSNKSNGFDSNGSGGNVFYNNVAYKNGNFGFEDGWKNPRCTLATCKETFINNIGYNNGHGNFAASAYTAVSHNNLWFSGSGSAKVFYNYTAYSSLSKFYSASGNRLDNPAGGEQASIRADPQFTDAPGGLFTVQTSSPAIDQGDPANPGEVTAINRVDIGAFENDQNPTLMSESN